MRFEPKPCTSTTGGPSPNRSHAMRTPSDAVANSVIARPSQSARRLSMMAERHARTPMPLQPLKKEVAAIVDTMAPELLSLSHAIHDEPELALEEVKAAARL